MKNIIWQPEFFSEYDFKVYLDRRFAREMINSKVSEANRMGMNKLANEDLKRMGVNWLNPYLFHEGSGFVSQFYIGSNGVWLSTSHQNITSLLKEDGSLESIEYHSHNVDRKDQSYALMFLFDKWIKYSEILRGKK